MDTILVGWCILIGALCLSTFGFFWCFTILLGLIAFSIGLFTILYLQHANLESYLDSGLLENPLEDKISHNGLKNVLSLLEKKKPPAKTDLRLTGSDVIDRTLREIMGYILRDHVHTWFDLISNDDSFDRSIRSSAQHCVSRISERVKQVDWLTFLTTRLVDEAAEHIKLYRQAREATRGGGGHGGRSGGDSTPGSRVSPHRTASPKKQQQAGEPQDRAAGGGGGDKWLKTHRRNKSDTDLKFNRSNKDVREKPSALNAKFYMSEQQQREQQQREQQQQQSDKSSTRNDHSAEAVEYFMSQDAHGQIVDDDVRFEEHLIWLTDLVLFHALPAEDFACPTLRSVLGTLIACAVLRPLFHLLADPDTVNSIILKICCREGPPAGEYLLTTLRFCGDVNELGVMREMVKAEIHQLRSTSSLNDSSSSVKQQIGSLQYVEKMINSKLGQLKGNIEPDTSGSTILPLLSFEQLLSGDVSISYYLDYLTQVNKQNYLFFYNTVEHWKTSVREYYGKNGKSRVGLRSGNGSHGNNGNGHGAQPVDELRETAQKIYDKFLAPDNDAGGSGSRVEVPALMLNDLRLKIQNKALHPTENWFDELQDNVFGKFKTEDVFLTDFYRSRKYIHMLAELDMLAHHQNDFDCASLDNDSVSSLELVNANTDNSSGNSDNSGSMSRIVSSDSSAISQTDTEPSTRTQTTDSGDPNSTMDANTIPKIRADDEQSNNGSAADSSSSSGGSRLAKPDFMMTDDGKLSAGINSRLDYMKHTRSRSDSIVRQNRALSPLRYAHVKTISSSSSSSGSNNNNQTQSTKLPCGGHATGYSTSGVESSMATAKFAFEHYSSSFLAENYDLTMEIIQTAIACEGGRSWGVYALNVLCHHKRAGGVTGGALEVAAAVGGAVDTATAPLLQWHVYRRYSHFLDLQKSVKKKFPDLAKLPFPAKKAFHNMDRTVLEHRKAILNAYVTGLCNMARRHAAGVGGGAHRGLLEMLIDFCEPQAYDKQVAKGAMIKTIDTIVNPLRSGMRSIKNMPDQLLNSVDELMGGLSRVLLGVPDEIDADNPAIRSALVLLDEAFDLKGRSQWLRRGVLSRALQGTWLGSVVNRRLLQLAGSLAGHGMVLNAISYIRNALWPGGERATSPPQRDQDTVHRTRIAAKTALLACFSDDLKHVLGSETTRSGLLNICLLLQHKQLNMRLLLVVLEGILSTLYPGVGKALLQGNTGKSLANNTTGR